MPLRRSAAVLRYSAIAASTVAAAGEAASWTVSKAETCEKTGSYRYAHEVTVVSGGKAQNTLMTVHGEWRPSPNLTTVKIDTLGRGSVTVRRLCVADPWAIGGKCTDDKVIAQTNQGWGLGHILKAAPDALAPKGLVPPPPTTVPVPTIVSQKWGGTPGLPIAIQVSGTGPRCATRFDQVRQPGGAVRALGPYGLKPGGGTFMITQSLMQQEFGKSGTCRVRSRLILWTGSAWTPGPFSPWFEFPFTARARLPAPPGSRRPRP